MCRLARASKGDCLRRVGVLGSARQPSPPSCEPDTETRLDLTGYRTLYVALVAEITAEDPRKDPAERGLVVAPDWRTEFRDRLTASGAGAGEGKR